MTISAFSRREMMQTMGQGLSFTLLLCGADIARGATILGVRVWPAQDYTRVTIESDAALKVKQHFIAEPPRLAVDIEGIDLSAQLRELVGKIKSDDPFISGIRIGQNAPGVVRLVIDLKQSAIPQVFNLTPVAAYQHRLVFDLHPSKEIDPLEALIAQKAKPSADALGDLMAEQAKKSSSTSLPNATKTGAVPANSTGDKSLNDLKNPPSTSPPTPPADKTAPITASTERLIIIALDPGHGGEDPGAIGPAGTKEKDIVLQIALRLQELINASSAAGNPMRAMLTRDADYFVPLHKRVEKAQRVKADLFVSIHADAFTTPTARGASVFALSEKGATSASARYMAQKENSADLVGGVVFNARDREVQRALLDMSTTAQIKDSLRLGSKVLSEIGGFATLHKPRVEQAGFAVLKAPDIPSVLIETAFISHPEEEQKLRDESYQQRLADAMLRGLKHYFAQNPPLARTRAQS